MALHGLDLNRLVALDALLHECSVSEAAAQLHVSQPAMSATLAALRDHFSDPLLISAGRSMRLSGFAQSLRGPLRESLLQVRALSERRPLRTVEHLRRTVTVVASDVVATVLLAPLAALAAEEAPGLQLRVRPIGVHLRDELDRGEVDIIVAAQEALADTHPREVVYQMPFVCVVWAESPLTVMDMASYVAAPHVVMHWPFRAFEPVEQGVLKAMGLARRVEVEVPTFSMMPPFLVQTRRVATMPRPLAELLCRCWPIKLLAPPMEISPLVGMVQWHRYQQEDPAIQWVTHTLSQLAARMGLRPEREGIDQS